MLKKVKTPDVTLVEQKVICMAVAYSQWLPSLCRSLCYCTAFACCFCVFDGRVRSLCKVICSASQGFSMGLNKNYVVAHLCVKIMFHALTTTRLQFEPDESWHYHLGICLCH